jgi:hypothetical protein
MAKQMSYPDAVFMMSAERQRRNQMANACGQIMRFPDRVRLPFAFDVPAMKADLAALQGSDWVDHFVKQNYSGDWSAIPLRAPAGETHPIRMIYSDPMTTDWSIRSGSIACRVCGK